MTTTFVDGRMVIAKPPPLPLGTLTRLLHLSNVGSIPLGTLLATTRSEGESLFTTTLGTKQQMAAAKALEDQRRMNKEAERQKLIQDQLQTSARSSRRGSAMSKKRGMSASSRRSSSAGSARGGSHAGDEGDTFSIPDYVKNPYAGLFTGKKTKTEADDRKRRRSVRKADTRRRSSAAWQMPSEEELERDVQPRPLNPTLFSRAAKIDALERDKATVEKRVVEGKEFNPQQPLHTPTAPGGANTGSARRSTSPGKSGEAAASGLTRMALLNASVTSQPRPTPRHIQEKLQRVMELGRAAGSIGGPSETIDWVGDQAPQPPAGGGTDVSTALVALADGSNGNTSPPAKRLVDGGGSGRIMHTTGGSPPRGSHPLHRRLFPIPLDIVHGHSVMVVQPMEDPSKTVPAAAVGAPLVRPKLPPVISKIVDKRASGMHASNAKGGGGGGADSGRLVVRGAQASPGRVYEIAILQHSDGTLSVKPNPIKYQQLLV